MKGQIGALRHSVVFWALSVMGLNVPHLDTLK